MSAITPIIKIAKKGKRLLKKTIDNNKEIYLSSVRRIERVSTKERICAMTFDDGPFNLPANPSNSTKSLTEQLLDTLKEYNAYGTFDVIGDTSKNYPDTAGELSSPAWGGIKYDHYPDINKDNFGGAVACPELITRMIEEGHEITNHGYAHIIFGKKPFVYGKRVYLENLDMVIEDLTKLHKYLEDKFEYTCKLSRPAHYVDKISGGFNSYDAYNQMNYQYMAASFDGAGWLPCKTYEDEVLATYEPMKKLLEADPDYFCGQIIFQKDGYNMAKRTPVVDGLPKQLEILKKYGYKVVTVSDLMKHSSFEDVNYLDNIAKDANFLLEKDKCVVYRDNKLHLENIVTQQELAMVFFGVKEENNRIKMIKNTSLKSSIKGISTNHPYRGAVEKAIQEGYFSEKEFQAKKEVSVNEFAKFCSKYYEKECKFDVSKITHRIMIEKIAQLEKTQN